jgi:hypothetical protein
MSVKQRRGSIAYRIDVKSTLKTSLTGLQEESPQSLRALQQDGVRPGIVTFNGHSSSAVSTSHLNMSAKKTRNEQPDDSERMNPGMTRSKASLKRTSPDEHDRTGKETLSNEKRSATCIIQ